MGIVQTSIALLEADLMQIYAKTADKDKPTLLLAIAKAVFSKN